MSWGYFADLRLDLATEAWPSMLARRPAEIALAPGWSTLGDRSLEDALGRSMAKKATFDEVLAWYEPPNRIKRIEQRGARTRVRIAAGLDGSLLHEVQPLAALLQLAAGAGGSGSLRLVDESLDGVELTLKGGTITRTETDWDAIVFELAAELTETTSKKAWVNPFAGLPILSPPRKTSVAEKPAAKKPAAKPGKTPAKADVAGEGLPLDPAVVASLESAVAASFAGAAGATLKRQRNAVGSNLDMECRRLELLGDASVVPALRAQIAKLPDWAKGSKKRIETCIAAVLVKEEAGESDEDEAEL